MYEISVEVAKKIVYELKTHIDANFNFIDKEGIIIASVDDSRVGSFHRRAKEIIDKNLDMLYVSKDMEDDFVKEGINLALNVHGEIVGVVGITGEKNDVMKFATIVKKMTEIMIEESIMKEDSRLIRHIKYRYLEDLISNPTLANQIDFINRGKEIGIDLSIKRRAVVISLRQASNLNVSIEGQRTIDSIDDVIREFADLNDNFLYLYLPSHYTFFYNVDDYDIERKLYSLAQQIKIMYDEEVVFGFGSVVENQTTYGISYTQALRANNLAIKIGKNIMYYDDLEIENYLFDISMDKMQNYIESFSKKIDKAEISDYINLMITYLECEGSISMMAEKLYLHKNTIQYRLQKLVSKTGFDIRKPSNLIYYFLFLEFYKIVNGTDTNN